MNSISTAGRSSLPILVALLLAAGPVRAQTAETTAATKSGEAWLALVEGGRHAESWQASTKLFQAAISQEKCVVESVTPTLDADGAWRVAGYFVN